MDIVTVKTGPHSLAQGVRVGTTAEQTGRDTVIVGYNQYRTGTLVPRVSNKPE